MFSRMSFYLDMAKKYKLPLCISECPSNPGDIVYEDEYQIGVINCSKFSHMIKTKKYV